MTSTSTLLTSPGGCPWCSSTLNIVLHGGGPCPRVKSIEYHPDGTIKRVEFND
jgi:hypothetical protein